MKITRSGLLGTPALEQEAAPALDRLGSWPIVSQLLALIVAFACCALFVRLAGQDPGVAARALFEGALQTDVRRAESLSKSIPLIMTGLSVALAFRAGFFNIGAEGQFLVGALIGTAIGTKTQLPVPFVLLGGFVAGAFWALLAGWLKLHRNAPEIITTIMLNYIALELVAFSLQVPNNAGDPHGWLVEAALQQPESDLMHPQAQLGALIPDTTLHSGLYIALACALLCWWLLSGTERGFLMRAVGANPVAARAAGIAVESNALLAIALSGALSGLGGAMEIAGATKQLNLNGFGYGYTAIAVALLANLNPLGVIPAALLFGMLDAGGGAMERSANVPAVTVSIVIGVVIFVVACLSRVRVQKS